MTRKCSACGTEDSRVVETRMQPFLPFSGNVVRRRRRCQKCFQCWWTVELTEDVALKLAEKFPKEALVVKAHTFTAGSLNDEDDEA